MAPLESHPPHVRKKIALLVTGAIGLVLLVVMVIYYINDDPKKDPSSGSQIDDFYTTVREGTQSFFNED